MPDGDGEAGFGIGAIDVRGGIAAVEQSADDLVQHQTAEDLKPHGDADAIFGDSNSSCLRCRGFVWKGNCSFFLLFPKIEWEVHTHAPIFSLYSLVECV